MECLDCELPPPDGISRIPPPPLPPEMDQECVESVCEQPAVLENNLGIQIYSDHWWIVLLVVTGIIIIAFIIVIINRKRRNQRLRQEAAIPLQDMGEGRQSHNDDT